ncbi:Lrp/AsnC family transcriptional regulator [Streptomyces sp. NPDC087270]|uniref:Lrp/AsnC family transcriptional regulator n=1 Tax=Streptomyces sp. NPDC087270 TaxID=3365774 RepID=UPI00381AB0DF
MESDTDFDPGIDTGIDTDARATTDTDTVWSALAGLDLLDRRLVHALQIDGRAPFSRLAEVLGVSDQTVARRYGRLRREKTVRVLGLADPLRIGLTPWMVRVRCTPDAAGSIGAALARRTDTRWVNLISGGTEISCLTQAAAPGHDDTLLLQKLPRTPRVVQVTAHAMLHMFFGKDLSPVSRSSALTPDEIAALTPPDAPDNPTRGPAGVPTGPPADPVPLGPGDHLMCDALAQDGRTSAAELAAVTRWSQSTVRRRLSELRSAGVLYYDLDFGNGLFKSELRAALWLEVEPARLAEVGAALADHSEVAFAAATTGATNIYASVSCKDPEALYRYLTGPVAALPGLRRTETAPIHRLLKGPGPYAA